MAKEVTVDRDKTLRALHDYTPNHLKIYVNEHDSFTLEKPNIFDWQLQISNKAVLNRFMGSFDMHFYQNQLNLATYIATQMCGIAVPLVNHENKLLRSIIRFHIYYQIRKCLHQLKAPLPGHKMYNKTNNFYDFNAFKRLKVYKNLRFVWDYNNGAGSLYQWYSHGYHSKGREVWNPTKHTFGPQYNVYDYNAPYHSRVVKYHIDFIKQNYTDGYKVFIPFQSNGINEFGLQLLNESIRMYVYLILGAQAEARGAIVHSSGRDLDAQKQFDVLLEDSINKTLSIPESISRYQKAIAKTHKLLNFVLAPGLCLIPSDLVLNVGDVMNYNNDLKVATNYMKFGVNDINNVTKPKSKPLPIQKKTIESKPVRSIESHHDENKLYLTVGVSIVSFILFKVFT